MRRTADFWLTSVAFACLSLFACSDDSESPPPSAAAGAGGSSAAGSGEAGTPAAAGGGAGTSGGTGAQAGTAAAGSGGAGKPAAAGSGGAGAPAVAGGGGASPDAGMPPQTANAKTLTAKIVAKNIPPEGQEHVCVVVDLGNPEPVWVNRATAILAGGSHHLIVDRRPASATLNSEATVCAPTMASDDSRLMIAQQAMTTLQLPAGVAFKLDARQKVFLQLHYFNVSSTSRDITGTVELTLADPEEGTPMEAQTLFTGSTQITLAARSNGEAKSFFMPPASESKRRYFALTSHTHKLGVRSTIERVATMNAPATAPLHESTNWAEPPLTVLDPPLAFTGSDGLRLVCRYRNDSDQAVHFGVEAEDEMCFMWLYFYDQR